MRKAALILAIAAVALAAGAALCAGCHLAPGMTKSDIRAGLYPHPPNLAQEEVLESRRAFWIVNRSARQWGLVAKIVELQRHADLRLAKVCHRFLQIVALLARDPHLVTLDLGLHFEL
jgi:hypothetical protein